MNLTSQYVSNPKSVVAYILSLATYKSIHPSNAKLRLGDDRQVLNSRKKYEIFRVDDITFKMIHCPRGKFTMGSNIKKDNNPKRVVSINKPFLLGETEITQELFEKIMGMNPSRFQGEKYQTPNSKKRPVEQVTQYDAVMFCNKLSEKLQKRPYYHISSVEYGSSFDKENITKATITINPHANGFRLPLGKEWEYAARAGTNNRWAGTNDPQKLDELAWFHDNSEVNGVRQTHPIKCKKPNEWGFYDMSGNVHEWCWNEHKKSSSNGTTYRGGGWRDTALGLRSAYCYAKSHPPGIRGDVLGFRISASLFN